MTVTGFTIACDSPGCPSIFILASDERLTVHAFATMMGDRMVAAGWTKDMHGNDLCPACSPRPSRRGRSRPGRIDRPADVSHLPTIEEFSDLLQALPPDLTEPGVLRPELQLYGDDRISIYFTPVASPNPKGRVLLVGLTPGRYQHWLATVAAAEALREGCSPYEASLRARVGAFAGVMRSNMVRMLDGIGLAEALGIESTASLWITDGHLMAATSAIRHAVILKATDKNYSGTPKIERHPILSAFVEEVLARDMNSVPNALVIPLGKPAGNAVARLGLEKERVLAGLPHPSGSNGHRARLYAERRGDLAVAVSAWASAT
jgi:hypothetical protein